MASEKGNDSFAALFEETAGAKGRRPRPKVGDRIQVPVIAIAKDAVFVDVGDRLEGYFETHEVADAEGKLPFEVGATITVLVEDTRGDQVRVAPLFVRAPTSSSVETEDGEIAIPVARSTPLLVEGATVRGTITSVERYGVFVQIEGTHGRAGRGLVPVAETLAPRGADLKKHYPAGTLVEAKILAIQDDGKIRLSMKGAQADAERAEFEKFNTGGAAAEPKDAKDSKAAKPSPRGFGTLADLLRAPGGAPADKGGDKNKKGRGR